MLLAGCGSDGDRVVVDFSKTVPVARPGETPAATPPLRVAVAAMISPKETFDIYRQLLAYLAQKLNRPLVLVQRKTYGEINELLGKGAIDLAFICSGPYVSGKNRYGFSLLAVPEIHGSHFYHAYLIVNQSSPFQSLEDLRGHTFAFTDPDSNTGKMVPSFWLAERQERPENFFSRVIYTYSHDNSIMAVARGLVDGAAVDGLIWDFYQQKTPAFTSRTRIIKKSALYGIPPLVASRNVPRESQEHLQKLLFSMHQDPEGKTILKELMIDRFVRPQEQWYDSLQQLYRELAQTKDP
jgi:phosphonate transport system substrate-binding protein